MQKYWWVCFFFWFCSVRTDRWESHSQSVSLALKQQQHRLLSFWKTPRSFFFFFLILRSSDFSGILITDTADWDMDGVSEGGSSQGTFKRRFFAEGNSRHWQTFRLFGRVFQKDILHWKEHQKLVEFQKGLKDLGYIVLFYICNWNEQHWCKVCTVGE